MKIVIEDDNVAAVLNSIDKMFGVQEGLLGKVVKRELEKYGLELSSIISIAVGINSYGKPIIHIDNMNCSDFILSDGWKS